MCQVGMESINSRGDINLIYGSTAGRSVVVRQSRPERDIKTASGRNWEKFHQIWGTAIGKSFQLPGRGASKAEVPSRVIQPTL